MLPERGVDVDQAAAGADACGASIDVDVDLIKAADIDDQSTRRRVPAVAVPAASRSDANVVAAGPAHGLAHVGNALAESNAEGADGVEA